MARQRITVLQFQKNNDDKNIVCLKSGYFEKVSGKQLINILFAYKILQIDYLCFTKSLNNAF